MQIRIYLRGKSITIDIPLDSLVLKLKEKVSQKYGIPVEEIVLTFKNQYLQNDKSLSSYGIEAEGLINVQTFQEAQSLYQIKQKLESLQEDNIKLKDKAQIDKIEIERMQEMLAQLKTRAQEEDQKNRQLTAENDEINSQLEQNKKLLNQKENEVVMIKQEMVQASGRRSQPNDMQESQFQGKFQQELVQLKVKVQSLEKEKEYQERLIQEVKDDKQNMKIKVDEAQKLKDELLEKKYQVKMLEKDLDNLKETIMQSKENGTTRETYLATELQKQQTYYNKLQERHEEVQEQNKAHEIEKVRQQLGGSVNRQMDSSQSDNDQKVRQLEKQVDSLSTQLRQISIENENLKNVAQGLQNKQVDLISSNQERNYQKEIYDQNEIVQRQKARLQAMEQSSEDNQLSLSKYKKEAFELAKKLKEQEDSMDNMKTFIKDKDRKYKDLEKQLNNLQMDLDDSKSQQEFFKTQIQNLKNNMTGNPNMNQDAINEVQLKMGEYERLQQDKEDRKLKEQQEQAMKQGMMAQRAQQLQGEQEQKQNLLLIGKEQRLKQGKFLKQQMMDTHGKIEVCFLVDVTASMDPYKEQAMICIDQSMSSIKEKTNRDVLWAAVAYQDFAELKQLGGLYRQIGFIPNGKEVQKFMNGISCVGGGDFAEDVRGGIKQMVVNLNWSKTFKIAMLICDAPTHGAKYNGGVSDRHPNEDIQDAIQMLIDNNILFVGVLFNKVTFQMFEEIKKMYKNQDREELLLLANLEGVSEGKLWEELSNLISQASMRATQTNNKGTKTKNAAQNKKSQDGAMEALCKTMKNPFEFEKQPGVSVVETSFTVLRVEIKQEAFEAKIENIESLDLKTDFSVQKEGTWKCIRTSKPFAFGQMKAVYLMKRQNYDQVELYVVKMPLGEKTYQSLREATNECRSHLISKCLMKKFIKDLKTNRDAKNPRLKFAEPQYSDFLLLQESENSFWIAERFFQGDFVKYNNNFGFVSDDDSEINHMAQAFTYYTFFVSNYSYMVSDVQGVGLYLTDPAVNTKSGNYDETDMGTDGQSMFMVAYSGKKQLGQVFLDLLGIKIE